MVGVFYLSITPLPVGLWLIITVYTGIGVSLMEQILFIGTLATFLLVVIVGLLLDLVLLPRRLKAGEKRITDYMLVDYYKTKYPLVTEEFMTKTKEEQLIENNQEIHELNKRLDDVERYTAGCIDKIDRILDKLNTPQPQGLMPDIKNHTM